MATVTIISTLSTQNQINARIESSVTGSGILYYAINKTGFSDGDDVKNDPSVQNIVNPISDNDVILNSLLSDTQYFIGSFFEDGGDTGFDEKTQLTNTTLFTSSFTRDLLCHYSAVASADGLLISPPSKSDSGNIFNLKTNIPINFSNDIYIDFKTFARSQYQIGDGDYVATWSDTDPNHIAYDILCIGLADFVDISGGQSFFAGMKPYMTKAKLGIGDSIDSASTFSVSVTEVTGGGLNRGDVVFTANFIWNESILGISVRPDPLDNTTSDASDHNYSTVLGTLTEQQMSEDVHYGILLKAGLNGNSKYEIEVAVKNITTQTIEFTPNPTEPNSALLLESPRFDNGDFVSTAIWRYKKGKYNFTDWDELLVEQQADLWRTDNNLLIPALSARGDNVIENYILTVGDTVGLIFGWQDGVVGTNPTGGDLQPSQSFNGEPISSVQESFGTLGFRINNTVPPDFFYSITIDGIEYLSSDAIYTSPLGNSLWSFATTQLSGESLNTLPIVITNEAPSVESEISPFLSTEISLELSHNLSINKPVSN